MQGLVFQILPTIPFLRKLLEDVLQSNKGVKHERGWQWIDETMGPVRKGEKKEFHRIREKGDRRRVAV